MLAARALLSPTGVRGVAVEALWSAAHLALYPMGLIGDEVRNHRGPFTLDALAPVQRGLLIGDVEAAGTPILLVHGMVDNKSIFTLLRRGLRRRGFGRVMTFNYSLLSRDLAAVAADLSDAVEVICADSGYERVHIVGHSMGGLVARYYVQCLGGDARVHTLVTLGTPHQGTTLAHVLPHPLLRQMRPGSAFLTELAQRTRCDTRFVAMWSDLDQLVVPRQSGSLDHPDLTTRNVCVRGVGHMSMPVDGRVVHEVCTTLAHLDTDGSTLNEGVTPLRRASATAQRG